MAEQDYVERAVEPVAGDHRTVTVALTPAGRAAWREANVTYRRVVQQRFAAKVTDSDLVVLQRLLTKTAL